MHSSPKHYIYYILITVEKVLYWKQNQHQNLFAGFTLLHLQCVYNVVYTTTFTMCLNLICPTGVRSEGTELILDKNPGVKGSLKSINP